MRRPLFDDPDAEGRRPWRGSDADLDITPMIDVTFLLLIFFMVTSSMQADVSTNLPPLRHGTAVNAQGAVILRLEAGAGGGPAILRLEGRDVSVDEMREAVAEAVRDGRTSVIIRADQDLPSGTVQDLAEQVASVEGVEIHFEGRDVQVRE